MFKYLWQFPWPKPKPRRLIRVLRRLAHERNYWRNRSLERRGKKRR
jgi:hypothetical protein